MSASARPACLPTGNVRLADDRVLRCVGPWPDPRVPESMRESAERSSGYVYAGPKNLRVVASIDRTDKWGPLLHVSLSYPDRNPSWRDVRLVKDAFYGPHRDAMMVLPREELYVNVHEHCFQLWECPLDWGMM